MRRVFVLLESRVFFFVVGRAVVLVRRDRRALGGGRPSGPLGERIVVVVAGVRSSSVRLLLVVVVARLVLEIVQVVQTANGRVAVPPVGNGARVRPFAGIANPRNLETRLEVPRRRVAVGAGRAHGHDRRDVHRGGRAGDRGTDAGRVRVRARFDLPHLELRRLANHLVHVALARPSALITSRILSRRALPRRRAVGRLGRDVVGFVRPPRLGERVVVAGRVGVPSRTFFSPLPAGRRRGGRRSGGVSRVRGATAAGGRHRGALAAVTVRRVGLRAFRGLRRRSRPLEDAPARSARGGLLLPAAGAQQRREVALLAAGHGARGAPARFPGRRRRLDPPVRGTRAVDWPRRARDVPGRNA